MEHKEPTDSEIKMSSDHIKQQSKKLTLREKLRIKLLGLKYKLQDLLKK